VRDVLNRTAPAASRVLDPLKVVIENYPEGQVEEMEVVNNPEDPSAGHAHGAVHARAVDRARRLHGGPAEEVLPLAPGREVRLRSAYFVTCTRS
jgi:glutaminyl-tRNA synthetase